MANCESYSKMSLTEQKEFVAKILHCLQNDEYTFYRCRQLIEICEQDGLFDRVKFLTDLSTHETN